MQQLATEKPELKKLKELKNSTPHLQKASPLQVKRDPFKRAFDILFSLGFLFLFSPLFLLLFLLIPLTSKGPIIYKSPRMGRGGKTIYCLKFRTMYEDAEERLKELLRFDEAFKREWQFYQKVEKDPRITPIGRFLRKYSLDEIPQFINVLKGDLSVVGPRPPTLMGPKERFLEEISKLYGEKTENILSVRPGITGVWQVSGRSKISFDRRMKIEEDYAKNRTFLTDLILILKTIPAVFFSRGAF